MLNLIPTPYRILGALALLLGACAYSYFMGWSGQHDQLVSLRAKYMQAALDQAKKSSEQDEKAKKELENAKQETVYATNSIAEYYRTHPVRVLYQGDNPCTVSKADSNSKSVNGTASIGYVSPYNPEQVEQVANRLDQLQKLLIKDGVIVE